MTAFTPERMRALAVAAHKRVDFLDHASDMTLVEEVSTTLRAAADEVDRLRAELSISDNRAGGYEEVVARLRAVIENAPHGYNCFGIGILFPDQETLDRMCTCWKADTL